MSARCLTVLPRTSLRRTRRELMRNFDETDMIKLSHVGW